MTAPERLDDAPFDALADWLGAQMESHNVTDPSDEQTTWIEIEVEDLARRILASDWLAQHVARAVAESKAEALREAVFEVPFCDPEVADAVIDWLRDCADREGQR